MASFTRRFLFENDVNTSVYQLWSTFKAKCLKILDTLVVSKWSWKRFNQTWITAQVKRISRRQKHAHSKARNTNAKRDWSRCRKLRREAQSTCRQAYHDYLNTFICDDSGKILKNYILSSNLSALTPPVSPLRHNGLIITCCKNCDKRHADTRSNAND